VDLIQIVSCQQFLVVFVIPILQKPNNAINV